ncbi:MAG: tetratricopeptide repeat protein [Anaerolineae bacterium]
MTDIRLQEYIQQVDELVERGQYDEALAHLRHILQHYPKFLPAYRLMGKTLLEIGQDDAAEEMFQRVLSGDPEDFVARVGLSVIYDRQGDLQRAIWHMERAFELAPDNHVIQDELRRLYSRRDGVVPPRVMLTRGALARLYARGGLFSRAVETFRSLLAEEPERVDLRVALAEALWNDGQRVQAEEACLRVLDELPYCLKANLILGEIWTRSGREEAQVHLRRAEAVDPENQRAGEVLGDASPLSPREVYLPYLEYGAPEIPVGRPVVGAPVPEEQALVDLERAAEIQIEIPAWLEEIGLGEERIPSGVEEEGIAVPAWLMLEEVGPEVPAPSEIPEAAEIPEWLREVAPPEAAAPEAPAPAEIPEWLREMAPPEAAAPETPKVPTPEAVPSWLEEGGLPEGEEALAWLASLAAGREAELRAAAEAEAEARMAEIMGREVAPPPEVTVPKVPEVPEAAAPEMPAPAEIPEWLREMAPPEVAAPETPKVPTSEAVPSWLEEGGLPEGEEALAWLASLAAGREAELRAAAEAEAEARMAEIMGREVAPPPEVTVPKVPEVPEAAAPEMPAPAEIPEWLREMAPPEVAAPEAPVPAEIPEWLREVAPPEAAPGEPKWEEELQELLREVPGVPEWLEEVVPPEVPRAEVPPAEPEVFGWTIFGAEAEIFPPPPPVEEAPPPERPFGWTAFGEEVVAPEVPAVREPEMPGVEAAPPPTTPLEAVGLPEVVPPTVVPPEGVAPPASPPTRPEVAPPAPPAPEALVSVETLRAHLRARPRDHAARLNLARALWQAGLYADSLEAYSQVLRTGRFLEEVLADMEAHVAERPHDPVARRVLGDAYMRAERLADALAEYRIALDLLK